MVKIGRFDPRKDKEGLKPLFEDFMENKAYFKSTWEKFEEVLNKRVLDLQMRNSMIVAKEEDKIVGFGTFTVFSDYLGNQRALIHQVMTYKADSFKKGIEEQIIRELITYIKNTFKMDKYYIICPDSDSSLRSLLMKLGPKKTKFIWYEKDI